MEDLIKEFLRQRIYAVKECAQKGIKRVWIQPGAESPAAIQFCRDNGIKVIYNICIMLASPKKDNLAIKND